MKTLALDTKREKFLSCNIDIVAERIRQRHEIYARIC